MNSKEVGLYGSLGGSSGSGESGVSPTITVADIDGGHRITITDVNGEKTVDVMDGEDGANGTNGATGTAAGFGTPTATVDANVGTPSVAVTASGANTAKVFAFAFKNLKGATGEKGTDGASITSVNLVSTEGVVTGGTCTLSDGTAIDITVTAASV